MIVRILVNLLNLIVLISFIHTFYLTYKNEKVLDKGFSDKSKLSEEELKMYKKVIRSFIIFFIIGFIRGFIVPILGAIFQVSIPKLVMR